MFRLPARGFFVLMLLLAAAALLAAACGGDEDDPDNGSVDGAATTAPANGDGDSDGNGGGDSDYLTEVTAVLENGEQLLIGLLPYAALNQQRMVLDEITAAVADLDPPEQYQEGHDYLLQSIEAAREGVEYQESLESAAELDLSQTAEYFTAASAAYYEARQALGVE